MRGNTEKGLEDRHVGHQRGRRSVLDLTNLQILVNEVLSGSCGERLALLGDVEGRRRHLRPNREWARRFRGSQCPPRPSKPRLEPVMHFRCVASYPSRYGYDPPHPLPK